MRQLIASLFCAALLLAVTVTADQTYECVVEKRDDESVCIFRNVNYGANTTGVTFKAPPPGKIQHVAFEDSTLDHIPKEFLSAFPNLRSLSVPNANLSSVVIPTKLERLYASGNQISRVIVHQTRDSTTMQELMLDSNHLRDVSNLTRLVKLEILNLSDNRDLPVDDTIDLGLFKGMDGLRHLLLSDVGAHYVENEQDVPLPNLELLDLSNNRILTSSFKVKALAPLKSLQILRLGYNQLVDLDVLQLTQNNPQLKQIYLEGSQFPCKLQTMILKHLKRVGVETPVTNPEARCPLGFDKEEGLCCKSDLTSIANVVPQTPGGNQMSGTVTMRPMETSTMASTTSPVTARPTKQDSDGNSSAAKLPLGNGSWLISLVLVTVVKLALF
uniref:Uncharacterized protein n=1 Tax=Anopheles epiroticus TaxID=199890 RepID=A0A182PN61_9DIPT